MRNLKKINLLSFVLLALIIVSCKQDDIKPQSVSDILTDSPDFSILNSAVKYAGFQDAFKTSQLSLFAPNDAAFKASGFADASAVTSLPIEKVRALLSYHLFTQKITSKNLNEGEQEIKMFSKETAYLAKNIKGVSVNGVVVSTTDIEASNGVVHSIDKVITPPTQTLEQLVKANPNISLFLQAVTKVSLTNPDFQKLLTSSTAFTIFAPNNKAMEAIGYSEVGIKNTPPSLLGTVLLYHVAQGRFFISNLATNSQIPVWGIPNRVIIIIKSDATGLQVRGAGPTVANVNPPSLLATNGVLHVVDKALVP